MPILDEINEVDARDDTEGFPYDVGNDEDFFAFKAAIQALDDEISMGTEHHWDERDLKYLTDLLGFVFKAGLMGFGAATLTENSFLSGTPLGDIAYNHVGHEGFLGILSAFVAVDAVHCATHPARMDKKLEQLQKKLENELRKKEKYENDKRYYNIKKAEFVLRAAFQIALLSIAIASLVIAMPYIVLLALPIVMLACSVISLAHKFGGLIHHEEKTTQLWARALIQAVMTGGSVAFLLAGIGVLGLGFLSNPVGVGIMGVLVVGFIAAMIYIKANKFWSEHKANTAMVHVERFLHEQNDHIYINPGKTFVELISSLQRWGQEKNIKIDRKIHSRLKKSHGEVMGNRLYGLYQVGKVYSTVSLKDFDRVEGQVNTLKGEIKIRQQIVDLLTKIGEGNKALTEFEQELSKLDKAHKEYPKQRLVIRIEMADIQSVIFKDRQEIVERKAALEAHLGLPRSKWDAKNFSMANIRYAITSHWFSSEQILQEKQEKLEQLSNTGLLNLEQLGFSSEDRVLLLYVLRQKMELAGEPTKVQTKDFYNTLINDWVTEMDKVTKGFGQIKRTAKKISLYDMDNNQKNSRAEYLAGVYAQLFAQVAQSQKIVKQAAKDEKFPDGYKNSFLPASSFVVKSTLVKGVGQCAAEQLFEIFQKHLALYLEDGDVLDMPQLQQDLQATAVMEAIEKNENYELRGTIRTMLEQMDTTDELSIKRTCLAIWKQTIHQYGTPHNVLIDNFVRGYIEKTCPGINALFWKNYQQKDNTFLGSNWLARKGYTISTGASSLFNSRAPVRNPTTPGYQRVRTASVVRLNPKVSVSSKMESPRTRFA